MFPERRAAKRVATRLVLPMPSRSHDADLRAAAEFEVTERKGCLPNWAFSVFLRSEFPVDEE